MENYEKLLEEAYKKVKPVESKIGRFEMPKAEGHVEGNKTILTNFKQICDYMRRDCPHVLKYLLRELATAGSIKGDRLFFVGKITGKTINDKIQQYIKDFVFCKECGKPDTEILKRDRMVFVHCLACGAKHSVTSKA